jgi:putative transcriptional regulator
MPVDRWRERRHEARCVSRTAAAVLVTVVSLLAAAALQALSPAAFGPQLTRSPLQSGRVEDLAPGALLVASRDLADPNFRQTVIVLLDHDKNGTMGLVVNRQTDVPLSRVFQKLPAAEKQSAPVYVGGPVSMTAVQALVRSSGTGAEGQPVAEGLHVIRTRRALEERLGSPADPARFRVYLGYSGWAPGQLAQEVGVGAWHIFPADAGVVFDPDPDTLWDRQIRETEWLLASTGS